MAMYDWLCRNLIIILVRKIDRRNRKRKRTNRRKGTNWYEVAKYAFAEVLILSVFLVTFTEAASIPLDLRLRGDDETDVSVFLVGMNFAGFRYGNNRYYKPLRRCHER